MLSLFKRPVVIAIVGLAAIGCLVWFAGPYFAFADYHPLATAFARAIAIVAFIVAWAIVCAVRQYRATRAGDRLMAAVATPVSPREQPSAEAVQLRERFEQAIATLKQHRGGRHGVYELPWYVIIGPPGSGKTTAIANSGLRFPLASTEGKPTVRGVGGTRNCEWLFADEAVFLDTAGRYTTQDSDAAGDSSAWREFLSLLCTHRPRRPINGIIVALSAAALMEGDAAREHNAATIRRRLNELYRELRIALPVYVIVTKCDLLSGFTEYFDDLTPDDRRQVWGVTLPYGRTAAADVAQHLSREIDALVERLNGRVLPRIAAERDLRRRAKIFGFPQQVAAVKPALAELASAIASTGPFDERLVLRGLYLTSGTQAGTPVDHVLGKMANRFGVTTESMPTLTGRVRAFFVERLLKDVVLPEAGLAGVNRRVEIRKAAAQLGVYAALIAMFVFGAAALTISYRRNLAYVHEIGTDVRSLQKPTSNRESIGNAVPRLDAIRHVVDVADRYRSERPWSMRWGLYQGSSIGNAARDAYLRELDGALLPLVAARIRQRMIDSATEPEKLYAYLKAYLMLGQPQHLDKTHLRIAADLSGKEADHFAALLEYQDSLRPIPLDQPLIAQARSTIRQASLPELMYRQIRYAFAVDDAGGVRLDLASGVGIDRVLRRKSGVSLSRPIARLYTPAAFKEITTRDASELGQQFMADQWVWGAAGAPPATPTTLASDVGALYEQDYIAAWDRVVKDIEPVPMGSVADAKEALAILAAPTSPLRGLLKTIDENTFLVKPPERVDRDKGIRDRLTDLLRRTSPAAVIAPPGTAVTTHFAAIHQLVTGQGGNVPLDGVLEKFKQIQQKLEPVGTGVGQTDPLDAGTVNGVGELVTGLKRDAATLPPAVGSIVAAVANGTARVTRAGVSGTLESRYQQDVLRACTEVTMGRYPFVTTSAVDVPLADFGRLFGYGGVFDAFFVKELAPLVDTRRSPWVWRADASGASVGPSNAMLRQFETAERIRETFFKAGSQEPEVRFRLTPAALDPSTTRFVIEIDGQRFEYRHGPERSWQATWPGPMPGAAAVTFEGLTASRPNRVFDGPWALFRLVDAAQLQRDGDSRYALRYRIDGHEARVSVEATSIRNPFGARDLQQFRCGAES